jgi:hypothetical protein
MKKCFSHNFHYQNLGWKVCNVDKKKKVIEIQDEEKYDKMCDNWMFIIFHHGCLKQWVLNQCF